MEITNSYSRLKNEGVSNSISQWHDRAKRSLEEVRLSLHKERMEMGCDYDLRQGHIMEAVELLKTILS